MTQLHESSNAALSEYLEAVLEHSSDAVAIVDETGRLRCASSRMLNLSGLRPEDLVGRRALAFIHPDDRVAALRLFRAVETGQEASSVVVRVPHAEERLAEYELRASRVGSPTGGGGGLLVSMRDLTERHRLEFELTRVQRLEAIGRLAGAVAHDFNNLLTAIRSYAVFAREAAATGESSLDDLLEILEATDRGEILTRQLLVFARRQVHEPRLLDLGELLRGCARVLERLAGEKYRLVLDTEAPLWPVVADPAQLEQCLVNLVMNAVDAMPDGGVIDIRAANLPGGIAEETEPLLCDCVGLSVRDHGSGFEPQARAHLFEPFFTTKEQDNRSGLGLAVVYGVVLKHGGRVTVHTETGTGVMVSMLLPRATAAGERVRQPSVFGPRAPMSGVALVVEDDDLVRSVISRALAAAGLVVHECGNGSVGLEIAARLGAELDVLVTDVIMPGMGGQDLTQALRQSNPQLPALFVTGYAQDAAMLISELCPRDRLLRKPFAAAQLVEIVAELMCLERC